MCDTNKYIFLESSKAHEGDGKYLKYQVENRLQSTIIYEINKWRNVTLSCVSNLANEKLVDIFNA